MICSFLAAAPGRRPRRRLCCWGSPVLRVGFRDGRNPTHARFCGVSLLAAAKLQCSASSLEFLPLLFFGVSSSPRAGAYAGRKTGVHAPCETSTVGIRGRRPRKKNIIAHFGQAGVVRFIRPAQAVCGRARPRKRLPTTPVTEILLTRHSWTARTRGSTQFDLPAAYHLDSSYIVASRFPTPCTRSASTHEQPCTTTGPQEGEKGLDGRVSHVRRAI